MGGLTIPGYPSHVTLRLKSRGAWLWISLSPSGSVTIVFTRGSVWLNTKVINTASQPTWFSSLATQAGVATTSVRQGWHCSTCPTVFCWLNTYWFVNTWWVTYFLYDLPLFHLMVLDVFLKNTNTMLLALAVCAIYFVDVGTTVGLFSVFMYAVRLWDGVRAVPALRRLIYTVCMCRCVLSTLWAKNEAGATEAWTFELTWQATLLKTRQGFSRDDRFRASWGMFIKILVCIPKR